MVDALVQTKLVPPRVRPELVDRSRLTDPLARARDVALVLVSAPAGFGKTTLLASILGDGTPVAWVSLDAGDSDAARFWTYALHALEATSPGCAATALALLEAGNCSLEDVVASLVNEVSVRSENLTLVLDDYHLADSAEVSESVALLLEHLPPQLHLVISTRADPTLPLSRLRARGELVEIRAADLRFTPRRSAATSTAFTTWVCRSRTCRRWSRGPRDGPRRCSWPPCRCVAVTTLGVRRLVHR